MVEFVLVAFIFFAMLIGIVEIGRLVYGLNAITSAAREGGRFGIATGNYVPGNTSSGSCIAAATDGGQAPPIGRTLMNHVLDQAGGIGLLSTDVVVNDLPGPPHVCTVSVTWRYLPLSGFFGFLSSSTHNFTSTSTQNFQDNLIH